MLNPIEYTALADYINLQDIPVIEGSLTSLFPTKEGEHAQYGKWRLRGGVLSNGKGLEHAISFTNDTVDKVDRNQYIRIESGRDKKGKMAGLTMSIRSYKDNKTGKDVVKREIKVDDRAVITVSGAQAASQSPPATMSQPNSLNAPQVVSVQSGGYQVSKRIDDYLETFKLVAQKAGRDPDELLKSLTATDFKDITTGQVMSFKGQYGVWAPVDFGRSVTTETKNASGEYTWDAGWKAYVYPPTEKGKALAGYPEEKLREFAIWALITPVTEANKQAIAQLSLMSGEKGWTPLAILTEKLKAEMAWDVAFEKSDLDAVLFNVYGLGELETLDADQSIHLLKAKEYKELLDACVERGTASAPKDEEFPQ